MKSVLISIQPNWCVPIAELIKNIDVRKTRPRSVPFKAFIYCTKGKFEPSEHLRNNLHYDDIILKICEGQGKVIGEFVCDTIITDKTFGHDALFRAAACISDAEAAAYCLNNEIYGWHISDLVIYDKPKELSDFHLAAYRQGNRVRPPKPLTRPPQSWCYVEEVTP